MERIFIREGVKEINVTLTERELFLIKWSLELMRNTIKGGMLKYDVESIRNKLSTSVIYMPEIEKN
jgi:hypothetical protein